MLARAWISVALSLVLVACGGDKDGGSPTDTGPTTGETTPPPSPLEIFEGNDWYGSFDLNGYDYPCEANLSYDAGLDAVVGSMDINALWDVTIVENDDGSFSGTGAPVFGEDVLELSNLAVSEAGVFTGDYSWDYGNGVYSGSFAMELGGPQVTQ
jgi:hypothetical protein